MSDIQEEIKIAHRKALEQDFNEIIKELKQEEHKNLELSMRKEIISNMKEKENNIVAQIKTVNDMLEVICDELNNLESIDDYEIELDSQCYRTIQNKRPYNKYKILVTAKRNLEYKEQE